MDPSLLEFRCYMLASLPCGRRQWQPTPVLLPRKSHGRRSLVGCSPWGLEESGMTEQLHFHFSLLCIGEGNGTPLQYSCLENPMDGGAWYAAVHGVTKSQTWLSDFTFTFHFHASEKEMATHSSALPWRIPGTGEPGIFCLWGDIYGVVYGVAQSRTGLKQLSGSSCSSLPCNQLYLMRINHNTFISYIDGHR